MWLAFVAVAAAGENLIANGSFEEGDGAHWTPGEGAVIGAHAPKSVVAWPTVDGSHVLELRGTSSTMSWTVMQSDPVAVTAGTELILSGRMKTDGVKREGGQYENCNLVVVFLDATGKRVGMNGTARLSGSRPWSDQRLLIAVPSGATTARLGAFLSMTGTAWFDDLKLIAMPTWITARSEHYEFHWLAEAPISERDRAVTEQAFARIAADLGVSPKTRIPYYRYASIQQKTELTGKGGNAHTDDRGIHTIWPVDDHEVVHILTAEWGKTDLPLLGEGIAVHESGNWQGRPVDSFARDLLASGSIPPLATIVDPVAFRAADELMTYAVAGSFVGYLVRSKDMDAFKRVYVKGAPLDERLKSVYGKDLATLDADWRASLAKR